MALFGSIDMAGSALTVYRTWLDAVSDNMSNLSTVRRTSDPAFQERFVVAESDRFGRHGGSVAGSTSATPRAASSTSRTTRSPTRRA